MKKETFADIAKAWLVRYRNEVMGVTEDGVWRGRRSTVHRRPHILPDASRAMNILEPYRSDYYATVHPRIKEHQFFAHLNSSQAFCINLFFPLMAKAGLGAFLSYMGIDGGEVDASKFELESALEPASRHLTSFDFFVSAQRARVFVECKYTEGKFGGAARDKNDPTKHERKFEQVYRPLVERSRFIAEGCRDMAFFLGHYQIMRNLVHLTDRDFVVFLIHPDNKPVCAQAINARDRILNDEGHKRFRIVYQPDLVDYLGRNAAGGALAEYYLGFARKYFPVVSA